VFAEEQPKTTASVFLQLKAGSALSAEQILSVQHLISSAVPDLAVEDVSVVDADGTLLSATGSGSADQAQSDYEEGVRQQIQAMLDRIVGAGHATVAVTAQIQTESAQRTSESFSSPEEGDLALSESSTAEVYGPDAAANGANGASGSTGVLGPDNIAVPSGADGDTGTGTGSGASGDGYSNTSTDRVNAIDKVTEVRQIPAGALIKQSVSIAVDEAVEGVDATALESLVAAAAGIDEDRGDTIAVETVAFATANADTAAAAIADSQSAQAQESMQSLIQTGIVAGAVAIVMVVLILTIARGRKRGAASSIDLGEMPVSPVGGPRLDAVDDHPAVSGFAAAPQVTAGDPIAPLTPAENDLTRARAVVESLARTDPSRTAEYLQRLMDEPAGATR
jgi:flagellar M-ring protein FliF